MKIFIICILIILFLATYKKNTVESFNNINDDLNSIVNNIYKINFIDVKRLSDKIDNIKQLSNVNLTNNFTNTGVLKLTNSSVNYNKVKITGNFNVTNKDDPNIFLDIYPQYFIMIWARDDYIPKGWARCDGKIYKLDKNNVAVEASENEQVIKIRTPYLNGIMPRSVEGINFVSMDKINVLGAMPTINQLFNGDILPPHSHKLSTKYDSSLPFTNNIGFDYEEIVTNVNNEHYLEKITTNRYYDCGLFDVETCENPPYEANRDILNVWKNINNDIPIYYGFKYNKSNTNESEIINISHIFALDILNGNTNFNSVPNKQGYYDVPSMNYIYKKNNIDFYKNYIVTNTIDIDAAYCALNYIIKLT